MSMKPSCSCIVRSTCRRGRLDAKRHGRLRGALPAIAARELGRRDAVVRAHADRVDLVGAVEDRPARCAGRRRRSSRRDAPTSAELHEPDDAVARGRMVGGDVDAVADADVRVGGGEAVDRDLARVRPAAGDEAQAREARARHGDAELRAARRRRAACRCGRRGWRCPRPRRRPRRRRGCARSAPTRLAGTAGAAVSRSAERTASLPLTITSEPRSASVNQLSKPRVAVEVSTSVAHTMAVPNTIARAVRTVRSLRETMPRSARRFTSAPSCGRGSRRR